MKKVAEEVSNTLKRHSLVTTALLFSLLINIIYMPAEFYGGDSLSIKLEAINWVWNGDYGIAYEDSERVSVFLENATGQFYIGDDEKAVYHNRWGPFNLLYHAVPEFVLRLVDSDIAQTQAQLAFLSFRTVFAHNILNIILSAVFFIYLCRVFRLYSKSTAAIIVAALLVIYASFIWNYLRAQSYEILHLTLFTVFVYYYFCVLRESRDYSLEGYFVRPKYLLFNIPLLLLCLSKSFYLFLYPIIFLGFLSRHVTDNNRPQFGEIKNIFLKVSVSAIVVLLLVVVSYYVFFGFFTIGFGHHAPYEATNSFSTKHIPDRLYDYFLSKNFSIWVHIPLILLAVLRYPRFIAENRAEGLFLISVFSFMLVFFSLMYNVGEYCYGPRFFVFALPVLCIPAVLLIESLLNNVLKLPGAIVLMLLLAVFSYSAKLQSEMHTRPFFTRYYLEFFLSSSPYNNDDIVSYLNTENHAVIAGDLSSFIDKGKSTYLISEILRQLPVSERSIAKQEFRHFFLKELPSNLYFSRKAM